jgi:uncharacterized cupin superfamily protein
MPGGKGAAPHTHSHEHEAVVVIDGDITYRAGTSIMRATRGQFVYLPRGFEHEFTLNIPELTGSCSSTQGAWRPP